MGVTIRCKKTGSYCNLGYFGFSRFRDKVAELSNEEFWNHYKQLNEVNDFLLDSEESEIWHETFDKKTEELIAKKIISIKIVDFLFQSDCNGSIHYGACKEIYDVIKDYDDNIAYGYSARIDCAMFIDLKRLIKDCVDNKCDLVWS